MPLVWLPDEWLLWARSLNE